MLSPNVLVRQPLGFFRGIGKHALALVAQRKIDGGRNLLANGSVTLDLFADGFDRGMRTQEAVGQSLVFAQESQEQVLGLYIRRTELAGFIPCKEYDAPCFFRITLEHNPFPQIPPETEGRVGLASPEPQKRYDH